MYATPMAGQYLNYIDDQITFIKNLKDDIQLDLNVRLYFKDYGWDLEKRLKYKFPKIKLSSPSKSIKSQISECKLFISTYNASTYLETLFYNVPTILYFNLNHWEISDEAIHDFELLNSVGIFHTCPIEASKFLNEIYDNIEKWWNSENVQEAVNKFFNKYSKNEKNAVYKITSFIKCV
jgi:putative transferase (TIGR04331 family)